MNTPSSHSGFSDLVSNVSSYELRILKRYPDSGLPATGMPFALDIEVKTFREYYICVNATVVARGASGAFAGQRLAATKITTSTFSGCGGTGRMVFPADWQPTADNLVQFEVYYGEPANHLLTTSRAGAVTIPINLGLSQKESKNAGIITPNPPKTNNNTLFSMPGVPDVSGITRNIAIIAGAGVGAYLLFLGTPAIRSASNRTAKTIDNG